MRAETNISFAYYNINILGIIFDLFHLFEKNKIRIVSIIIFTFTYPTRKALTMIKFAALLTCDNIFNFEGKYFNRIFAEWTYKTFLALANIASIKVLAQKLIISQQFWCFLPVINIVQIFHTEQINFKTIIFFLFQ